MNSVRSVVTREILCLLILLTLLLTSGTIWLQSQWERKSSVNLLRNFEYVLQKDQDNLLLPILLARSNDLNLYFETLRSKYPTIIFCMDVNPPLPGLTVQCQPGQLEGVSIFHILQNRNYVVKYSVPRREWPQTLVDLLRTPLFYFTFTACLFLALYLHFRLRSLLTAPLTQTKLSINKIVHGERSLPTTIKMGIVEWNEIDQSLGNLTDYIQRLEKAENEAGRVKIARQVAHDIRSPLSFLRIAAQVFTEIPTEKRLILASAIQRIEEIADSLDPSKVRAVTAGASNVIELIRAVVEEKRFVTQDKSDIKFAISVEEGSVRLARVEPAQFKRIISNLINNSLDAIGAGGEITIKIVGNSSNVVIQILDTGHGISDSALSEVKAGRSVGKTFGQGLGLTHARDFIEAWGGRIELTSAEKIGSIITIYLIAEDQFIGPTDLGPISLSGTAAPPNIAPLNL